MLLYIVAVVIAAWLGLGILAVFACMAGARAEAMLAASHQDNTEASREKRSRPGLRAAMF